MFQNNTLDADINMEYVKADRKGRKSDYDNIWNQDKPHKNKKKYSRKGKKKWSESDYS